MNKKLFLAASVLAVSGLVAACGTDETSEVTTEETPTETVGEQNDTSTIEEGTEEEAEQDESTEQDTDPAGASEDSEEPAEQPAEDNPAVNEGTLTVSDSQSYELYLLPAYELTAEEPNKDVVYSTENDALFMRIETFKPDEADFAFAEESIQQTVQASNENAELTELPALDGAEFKNSSVYEIPTENGKVTGVAFEKDGLVVKLTIFDLTDASVTEEFLNMGKTIVPTHK
ncbi:hypothetical protein [Planococcus salinarum]|uniref:hypothetical protein n=1 Tax=Planococcus salinarum TaxID=622695 RepID=UPI000E3CE9AD|nr:hypothetical protein [Planococcus salinarum]TAA72163.1 hypothetical protein D2909_08195 [Planococcus salinarum]